MKRAEGRTGHERSKKTPQWGVWCPLCVSRHGSAASEPRRPLQKRGHNVCCDLFLGFRQEIKMLGRSEFALRQGFAAQNACTAQKRRFFGSSGKRVEQGMSEARKRPSGAFGARCACRGTAVLRASLVARSKKEVTTYVVTSFWDSGRKLKCSGEVNSPSAKVLLRKTLVRRKSVVFCFGRPNRYGTSELGVLFFIRTFPVND